MLIFLFRALLICRCAVASGSAVNAPAMTDKARPTAGENDEPITKHIKTHKEANPLFFPHVNAVSYGEDKRSTFYL